MAEAQYSANHIVNPDTGFLENPAYPNQFDSNKKTAFLKLFYENGLRIRRTCEALGMSIQTVNNAYQHDPVFKSQYDDLEKRYIDELEGVSRTNALNPRSVIERIFQLKCLLPEKYGQENKSPNMQISINIDTEALKEMVNRRKVLDAELVTESTVLSASQNSYNQIIDGNLTRNESNTSKVSDTQQVLSHNTSDNNRT